MKGRGFGSTRKSPPERLRSIAKDTRDKANEVGALFGYDSPLVSSMRHVATRIDGVVESLEKEEGM